jgi:hypothetical protein
MSGRIEPAAIVEAGRFDDEGVMIVELGRI